MRRRTPKQKPSADCMKSSLFRPEAVTAFEESFIGVPLEDPLMRYRRLIRWALVILAMPVGVGALYTIPIYKSWQAKVISTSEACTQGCVLHSDAPAPLVSQVRDGQVVWISARPRDETPEVPAKIYLLPSTSASPGTRSISLEVAGPPPQSSEISIRICIGAKTMFGFRKGVVSAAC
jgi:hypothetical protein